MNMKKLCLFFVILLLLTSCNNPEKKIIGTNVFTQTIDDDYIDYYDFIGIYLPVEYITFLDNTKNYIAAMHFLYDNDINTILIVKRDSISYYNYGSEVPSNIPVWRIMKYKFEFKNGYYIIDNNGNRYKKISDYVEDWYDNIHTNFVTNIIMKDLLDQGEVILNENGFIIKSLNNRQFIAITSVYIYLENANIYLVDLHNNWYVLEIKNNEYIIYICDREWKKGAIIWSKKL